MKRRPGAALLAAAARTYVPAPPKLRTVYDDPQSVVAVNGPGSDAAAAWADPQAGEVHLARGAPVNPFIRGHETGHVFDYEVLDEGARNKLTRIMGLSGPWEQGTGLAALNKSPIEAFADYYGALASGMKLDGSTPVETSYVTWKPRAMREIAGMLDRIGRRNHLAAYGGGPAPRRPDRNGVTWY